MARGEAATAMERPSHDVSSIIKAKMEKSIPCFKNLIQNRPAARMVVLIVITVMLYYCATTQDINCNAMVTYDTAATFVVQPKKIGDSKSDAKFDSNTSTLLSNLLQGRDDSLASGSNTTCVHGDIQVSCSLEIAWSELMFFIASVLEIFSNFISGVRNFFSWVFSNDCTSNTRNSSQRNAGFLALLLSILFICYNFKNVACYNNGADVTLHITSLNITVQDHEIKEQDSSSKEPLQLANCNGQEPTTNPTHNQSSCIITPVATSSMAHSFTGNRKFFSGLKGLVDEACPVTQLLYQLDALTPDTTTAQNISRKKVTSSTHSMVKFYCSKSPVHKVQLDDHTPQKRRENLPRIKFTLWTSCFVITLLLLVTIPFIYLYFRPYRSYVQEIDPGSSYLMVYRFHSVRKFSQNYIKMSAPAITGTHKCSFPNYQMTDEGSAFSNVINSGISEEGKSERSHGEVCDRQSSEGAVANISELIVGISFQHPVPVSEKKNKNDSGDASEGISKLPILDDAEHFSKCENSSNTEKSQSDADWSQGDAQEFQSDAEKSAEESQSVSGEAEEPLYSNHSEHIPASCGIPVCCYHGTAIKGFASTLGK